MFVVDTGNNAIRRISTAGEVTTFAGGLGVAGAYLDGLGTAARFNGPRGIALAPNGDLLVTELNNHVVRRITASGEVTLFAGVPGVAGALDGSAAEANFRSPTDLAVDALGTVYVVDAGNHLLRRISAAGQVETLAGAAGEPGSTDGNAGFARFFQPTGVAVDPAGNVYVSDTGNHTIRAIAPDGAVSTVAGVAGALGSTNGTGATARFNAPAGLALAPDGRLFVADTSNHTIRVAAIDGTSSVPVLTSPPVASGTYGRLFAAYAIRATGFPTGFSASGLPPGLMLNPTTGVISGLPTAAGTYTVTLGAANESGTGTATLSLFIAKANASVTLTDLEREFNGSAHPASAQTEPEGLGVQLTYNGSASAPAAVGTYQVAATIADANYQGAATGTLVIRRAEVSISLTGLHQTYDGTPRTVTATTSPAGLPVKLLYDGAEAAPLVPGSYGITAIVDEPGYTGLANATLVVAKAPAVIVLNNLTTTYHGAAQSPSVSTTPAGLTVNLSYNGSSAPPVNAGTYAVVATVNDALYTGTVAGSFVINKAPATVTLSSLSTVYDAAPQTPVATTAPAGLNVEFSFDSGAQAPINAGTYAVNATIVEQNYAGSTNGTFVIAKAVPQLGWTDPASIVYGTALSEAQLNADADVPGTFQYAPAAGTVLAAGTHQLTVSFSPEDAANYHTVHTVRELEVVKAAATITLQGLSAIYDGQPKPVTATTSPAGLTVQITYSGSANAPVNAGTWPVEAVIVHHNYEGATTGELVIDKAAQTISFAPIADLLFQHEPIWLVASASSGLEVQFEISGPALREENSLFLATPGQISVRALQSGNANYHPAPDVTQSFRVSANLLWWRGVHFTPEELLDEAVGGLAADPDRDGRTNLLEYALGSDPRVADSEPVGEVQATASEWIFSFRLVSELPDVDWFAESSVDLVNWSRLAANLREGSTDAEGTWWSLHQDRAEASRQFFRIRVRHPKGLD